jgi:hypothetical protein
MWRRVLNGEGHERMMNLRPPYSQTMKIMVDITQQKDIYLNFSPLTICSVMLPQLRRNGERLRILHLKELKLRVLGLF